MNTINQANSPVKIVLKMASRTTKQLVLANPPTGLPVFSGPNATFELQTVTLPQLKKGKLLCKVHAFSNDAGQRGFIQSTVSDERLYAPPVHVGSPIRSGVIAEVLETKSSKIKECQPLAPLPNGLSLTHYVGAFGGSGLTAYTGLLYAGGAKRDSDQTIVVSAAAGAMGSIAVQVAAKIFKVKRVIDDLKAATPDEVDIYFDNVGGPILDALLPRMKRLGRGTIAVCGAVAQYNADGKAMELHNWCEVFSARITIKGFIMFDYLENVPAALQEMIAAAADGRLDLSDAETVVEGPLEKQPEIWTRLFTGDNKGRLVTKLVA
ncbi:hypothetical protein SCAR479_06880 [Seiridium cardinale]|uniref:Oxidoreductase N-terminal domain-containing protein n=1 Tax=Seiridium cardinale TaxID=138064 RepID=A0ABR2XS94_9PEZI